MVNAAAVSVRGLRLVARAPILANPLNLVALALIAREHNPAAVGGCSNRNRLRLHNVASASGENPCCLYSSRLPFVRTCSLWEWSGPAARRATYGEV